MTDTQAIDVTFDFKGARVRCFISGSTDYQMIFSYMQTVYILKRKRNATVLNPLFLPLGPNEANFLIISCVPAQ